MVQGKRHSWKGYSQLNAMNQVALCLDDFTSTSIAREPEKS